MKRLGSFVFFLRWVFSSEHSVVTGFSIHHRELRFHRANRNAATGTSLSQRFGGASRLRLDLSADGDDDGTSDDGSADPPEGRPATEAITKIVDKASEYLVLLAGAGVAGTLALNVLGYGVVGDPGGGFRVDTVERLRTEKQMERSVGRPDIYAVEKRNPAGEIFRRYPFYTTLAITGTLLLVEEIKARNDKYNEYNDKK